jgi:hypothetical protein
MNIEAAGSSETLMMIYNITRNVTSQRTAVFTAIDVENSRKKSEY